MIYCSVFIPKPSNSYLVDLSTAHSTHCKYYVSAWWYWSVTPPNRTFNHAIIFLGICQGVWKVQIVAVYPHWAPTLFTCNRKADSDTHLGRTHNLVKINLNWEDKFTSKSIKGYPQNPQKWLEPPQLLLISQTKSRWLSGNVPFALTNCRLKHLLFQVIQLV